MTTSFDALGVAPDLVAALAARGITTAFAIQELTIADALAGRDVCGKAKTGSGKTLAFGLPVLQAVKKAEARRPRALILVPTRELATQVKDELGLIGQARDITVAAVYGGADIERQIRELQDGVEVVAATPGRMIDLIDRKEVDLVDVGVVVLDEADRMADMGFLPQVEWILRHIPG
ncbi:MAG: DEAD/DEAH box helicase, partial [Microthrixaceae bacterium]|nr:DEAD/DEAH box helicase [Microthrixaceae bacterium]